ncbi:MAG: DNA/RNA non-specific endonuclease [Opitutaceae bacterium]|nr:DNA/RNA non-specific endonuclease [Opitutaceae bacterium]
MSIIAHLLEQIQRADARLGNWDVEAAEKTVRGCTPEELNTPDRLRARLRFADLAQNSHVDTDKLLERIVNGNDLQDVNYLARGTKASRAIARIEIGGLQPGFGTGFLVGPRLLLTNHHVLPSAEIAAQSRAHFSYERDQEGRLQTGTHFKFVPDVFFHSDPDLDFALTAVSPSAEQGATELDSFGTLPLIETVGKVLIGEWLTIIQHPNGEPKQVCVRENQLLRIDTDVVWYSTDTRAGSSGSPVFNNDWVVIALHHSGVPARKQGRIQNIDGADWRDVEGEARIQWLANEGIRISRIIQHLRAAHGTHPALQPLFTASNAAAGKSPPEVILKRASCPTPASPAMNPNETRRINLQLEITPAGTVSVLPLESIPAPVTGSLERKRAPGQTVITPEKLRVPFDSDYSKRKGFRPDLLGKDAFRVNLPILNEELEKAAARHLSDPNKYELPYYNHTIVMHAERRLAIYSAASVRGDQRYLGLERENYARESDWRTDERISKRHQLENFFYKGNRFDRGHLTRNEDMEFGPTTLDAVRSALDTFHYTNIAPQHDAFNRKNIHQGDDLTDLELSLWGDLEKHILEKAVFQKEFAIQVISGPILDEGDPVLPAFKDIPYPVRFWKVVAGVDEESKRLFAVAFLLDQSAVINQLGLAEAVPIAPFRKYQVEIAEIERLTGLKFTSGSDRKVSLSTFDPLNTARGARRRSRRGNSFNESTSSTAIPEGYLLLEHPSQILL